jgi:hypothetical protein
VRSNHYYFLGGHQAEQNTYFSNDASLVKYVQVNLKFLVLHIDTNVNVTKGKSKNNLKVEK